MTKTNDAALTAFLARKTEIDRAIERLQALSADHFNVSPEAVNWGHVGDLTDYAAQLKRVTDAAFHEGEHAPENVTPVGRTGRR